MDLESYYRLNFALIQYHKYSLTEIENLIPWERDVYVGLLQAHLEDEKLKQQTANGKLRAQIKKDLQQECWGDGSC